MASFKVAQVTEENSEEILKFLRNHFFPNEPCAKAINLCPLGYRMDAVEEDIKSHLAKRLSLAAFLPGSNEMVGVMILAEKSKLDDNSDMASIGTYPQKFIELDKFFQDLCTNYGNLNIFDKYGCDKSLDIFIVCTRYSSCIFHTFSSTSNSKTFSVKTHQAEELGQP